MTKSKNLLTTVCYAVLSLAIAFCLWLAVAGQNRTTVELKVPFELINLPENLIIYDELPSTVKVQLLANTAQVRILSDRIPNLLLDATGANDGYNTIILDDSSLDLPRGVIVEKITPPTIEFTTTLLTDRMVNLNPTISGFPDPAFRVKSLTLEPNKVTLKGPQNVLDSITSLSTNHIDLSGLTRSSTRTITPDLTAWRNDGLTTVPNEIKAIISIEERQMGKIFIDVPILVDIKNGTGVKREELTITPDKAEIEVSWPASRQTVVSATDIKVRVFVDVEEYKKAGSLFPPVVVAAPEGVAITSINPVHVKVSYLPESFPEVEGVPDMLEPRSPQSTAPALLQVTPKTIPEASK